MPSIKHSLRVGGGNLPLSAGPYPPPDSLLGRPIEQCTIPMLMRGLGGWMDGAGSVVLANPSITMNAACTVYFAFKANAQMLGNSNQYRISSAGFRRFVLRSDTSGKINFGTSNDTNFASLLTPEAYVPGTIGIVAVSIAASGAITLRSNMGNASSGTGVGVQSLGNSINNGTGTWKAPLLLIYPGESTPETMDSVIAGGLLPASPIYNFCPPIQGNYSVAVVKSSAGDCAVTALSLNAFWSVDGTPLMPFGWQYSDTNTGLLWQKTRAGYFTGDDSATLLAFPVLNPTINSFSVVLSVMVRKLPTTSTALYRDRLAGVGCLIVVDAAGDLQWQVSKDGTLRYAVGSVGNVRVVPGVAYRIVCSWNHGTSTVEITFNSLYYANSGTISSPSADSAHAITTSNGAIWSVQYLARLPRPIPQAEALAIATSGYVDAAGADVVFAPAISGLTSGTSLPNYGYVGGNFTISDGTPGTWWGDWWFLVSKMIQPSLGSFTLPQIMEMAGGYLSEDVTDDSVTLVAPSVSTASGVTVVLAVRFDSVVFNNNNHYRFSPVGSFRFLFRSDSSGKLLISGSSDSAQAIKQFGVGYQPDQVILIAASFSSSMNLVIRSSIENSTATPTASSLSGSPSIASVGADWKLPIVAVYGRESSVDELDAIVAGGYLPAEKPAYAYCPALQGSQANGAVYTTAGAAVVSDASPNTFWTK
jgi:hypothetical protein